MKRSEMVSKLMHAHFEMSKVGLVEGYLDYSSASALLGRLEHEGMLPPWSDKSRKHAFSRWVGGYADGHPNNGHQWEPEDE